MRANGRTLLERLEDPDPAGERRVRMDENELRESIRRNLQRLLNSRHGGSPVAPDYGTPEFEAHFRSGKGADSSLARELARCIEKYEPRLRDVRVAFVVADEQRPLRLSFDISATMILDEETLPAVFHSVVETSGQIRIER